MLPAAVRQLFGRSRPPPFEEVVTGQTIALAEAAPAVELSDPRPHTAWPARRLALSNELWGPGFVVPGGEIETLRLARPLGMSAAASLLIVGVGSGGAASCITRNLGPWITGVDNDPSLVAAARGLISRAQLTKKVSIKAWDPVKPAFDAKAHHHILALEPLHGAQPEPILVAFTRTIRPGGQMVITELTAPAPLDPLDQTVSRWAALERRNPADLPSEIGITRMLGRVGMDVRVTEDISDRHLEYAMLGWRVMLRDLRNARPSRQMRHNSSPRPNSGYCAAA